MSYSPNVLYSQMTAPSLLCWWRTCYSLEESCETAWRDKVKLLTDTLDVVVVYVLESTCLSHYVLVNP